ncbi:MAG: hypothetical protein KIT16_17955 [Rhodospirillaceae bacterium]|nr:hypothetical protein [Rhodospirillaceae bacterium]
MLNLRFESWSVTFPEEWSHDIEDDILAIAPPSGASVLQIGSMSKDEGAVSDEDLWEFMDDAGVDAENIQRIKVGDFEGLAAETESDDAMLRYWILRAGEVLLLATFRTPRERPDVDFAEAGRVLESLHLEGVAPAKPH